MEGRRPERGNSLLRPAIFSGCTDDMKIVCEEIFGPVMSVLTFTDEDEVIERANATRFGLAAGVFTRDLARGPIGSPTGSRPASAGSTTSKDVTPIEMPFGGMEGIRHRPRERTGRNCTRYAVEERVVELGPVQCPYE